MWNEWISTSDLILHKCSSVALTLKNSLFGTLVLALLARMVGSIRAGQMLTGKAVMLLLLAQSAHRSTSDHLFFHPYPNLDGTAKPHTLDMLCQFLSFTASSRVPLWPFHHTIMAHQATADLHIMTVVEPDSSTLGFRNQSQPAHPATQLGATLDQPTHQRSDCMW